MRLLVQMAGAVLPVLLALVVPGSAQSYTAKAPDGTPGATFAKDCVASTFFNFSYRLPQGMSLQDMSGEPKGGNDPTGKNFILFTAHRSRGIDFDVVDAAAEDRRSTTDPSAASWIRALHHWNTNRSDVPDQGDVESITIGDQLFSRLRFRQSRNDGVITYEAAYAIGVRGFVVYFIFGSVDENALKLIEESMQSFSSGSESCTANK